ncbi:MAG: ester cyclase [Chloroflexi bacterium]|nr:ester cyclase [Chloroflexota bacterium]MCY4246021.1 ester cyclase [Chloroflexota bacterium]
MTQSPDKYFIDSFRYSPIDQARNIANKRRVIAIQQALAEQPVESLEEVARDGYAVDAALHVTHPINELRGAAAGLSALWLPLRKALPDMERRDVFVAGGHYRDGDWVACMGEYLGTFADDWLGIPSTRGVAQLRYCEAHNLRNDKITASYIFLDALDLMRQAGYFPIAPSLGREMAWLPPRTLNGIVLSPQDEARSRRTIETILRMHAALGYYSGEPPTRSVLDEMEQAKHWHRNFMWYGPAGIGTTRGLRGFEEDHQIPFLVAFPDRAGSEQGHFIRIGDGYFAVTGGWGYLRATHTGGGLFGMPATGKRIHMRVMDFYRCDDKTIVENWVPIDVPHILLQMGVDVFGRMRHQFRNRKALSAGEWLVGN